MKTLMSFCVVVASVAVITFGLFYGILTEVELRELKRDRMAYNMILADRALLERQAGKDSEQRAGSRKQLQPAAYRSRLTAHETSR